HNQPLGLWTAPEPDAAPALMLAREAGLRTGVISNSNGTIRQILARLNLMSLVDFALDSHEEGVEKPRREIFERALARAAVVAGIARLALLGWLLAKVLAGPTVGSLLLAVLLVAAVTTLRGALEYWRTMLAHHTAALVQGKLRAALYAHVTALGPAHFGRSRTGDVVLSMVEGIQQLEVYFGQYLPQLAVAALPPVLIFASVAFIDLPVALVTLAAALLTLLAPVLWHRR